MVYHADACRVDVDATESLPVRPALVYGDVTLYQADCTAWLLAQPESSIHGVVTDPPYALEYTPRALRAKSRNRGVWRIPPTFDGYERLAVPRFTELTHSDVAALEDFFGLWASRLFPALVPGAHVLIASNPLLCHIIGNAVQRAGYEQRGRITRLVHTMRGGDRPKLAHTEFAEVSVLPRSLHEPWLLFRKPLEGTVRENLRKWGTGGLRRPSVHKPFGDVIVSGRAERRERSLAPHPSLKPQMFMRQVVRAILPLGKGVVLDPFAGSGATLAAAHAVGYSCIGVERSPEWIRLARTAIPKLASLDVELRDAPQIVRSKRNRPHLAVASTVRSS